MVLEVVVFSLGFAIGILSGLLGIGGGILMAPALLYLPVWLGAGRFDMREVSGLTITQALFSCLSGAWGHERNHEVDRRLAGWMGGALFVTGLLGALLSRWTDVEVLKLIFAGLAVGAAILMALPKADPPVSPSPGGYSLPLAVVLASAVGLVCGMVGQGGSFLLIPLMLHVLKLPTKIALGSNLGLVFLGSIAGFAGKFATGQIPLLPAVALVLGAIPGAQLGSMWSRRIDARRLRTALAVVVALSAIVVVLEAVRHPH